MEKALRDRLLKVDDEISWTGNGPEDLKEATLFTLKALKAHLKETKPGLDYYINSITQAIAVVKINFAE